MTVRLPRIALSEIKDPYIRENFRQVYQYLQSAQAADEAEETASSTGTGAALSGFLLSGEGDPSPEDGDTGDFYLDTETNTLYGPKENGSWGDGLALGGSTSSGGTLNVVTASANYSVGATDDVVLGSAAGGAFSVYLPDATDAANDGRVIQVKKTDSGFNAITIDPFGAQTIDGASTKKLCTQYDEYTLVAQGGNWHVLSHTYPKVWTSYSATQTWGANAGVTAFWLRDGDSVELDITVALTGNANANALTVTIPNSAAWTINTAKTGSTSRWLLGTGYCAHGTVGNPPIWAFYNSTTTISPGTFVTNAGANPQYLGGVTGLSNASQGTWVNGNLVQFRCKVPITQLEG